MLSNDPPRPLRSHQANDQAQHESQRYHQYPTRHAVMSNNAPLDNQLYGNSQVAHAHQSQGQMELNGFCGSPTSPIKKTVTFELMFEDGSSYKARLPLRIQIFPHDTTESIVTTVKSFYGIYDGAAKGVSFEDEIGTTLIASYENFKDDMVVRVRVVRDHSQPWQYGEHVHSLPTNPTIAQRTPHLDDGFQMPPPQYGQAFAYDPSASRSPSRVARKQSASPHLVTNRRSLSTQKGRSHSKMKHREDSFQAQLDEVNKDAMKGYSSSDGEAGSVTSSRKARNEHLASAEISLENIVEGGRRQRAKFESSVITHSTYKCIFDAHHLWKELPLFVPPQVPAANSISSISPQRRSNAAENPSPFARPQRYFAWNQPLQSPQNYNYRDSPNGIVPASSSGSSFQPVAPHGHRLRERVNTPNASTRIPAGLVPRAQGVGILPTPDPTIASCISDEDVALQLMRLGDASNISHGRTSASTLDDTLSGRADIASSATSESEDESDITQQPSLPKANAHAKLGIGALKQPSFNKKHQRQLEDGLHSVDSIEHVGDTDDEEYQYDDKKDGVFKSDPDDMVNEYGHGNKRPKLSSSRASQASVSKAPTNSSSKKNMKSSKQRQPGNSKKSKSMLLANTVKTPLSPASLPPHSRKTSVASIVNSSLQVGMTGEEDLSTKPRCQRCRKSKKGCDRQRPCQRCQDAGIGADGCVSEDEGNGRKGRFGRHMGVAVSKDPSGLVIETEEAGAILDGMAAGQEKNKKRKR